MEGYTQIHTSNYMWGRKGNRIAKGNKVYFNCIYNDLFLSYTHTQKKTTLKQIYQNVNIC